MTTKTCTGVALLTLLSLTACEHSSDGGESVRQTEPVEAPVMAVANDAESQIDTDDLLKYIKQLSSDEFEGRLPGTPGGEKTVAYLVEQFKRLGLAPGNPDGSYTQAVPLVGITGQPTMQFTVGDQPIEMQRGSDFVATTAQFTDEVAIEKVPLVFVGYGVQAPEYDWNDYKGIDPKGKALVMLINDPPVRGEDGELDSEVFGGQAMTYYGRWTYKYDIASKLGAAAVIIVHETEPASYPWSVVEHSWTGEQFELAADNKNMDRVPVQGWITLDRAHELFSAAGQDFDALKKQAVSRDFEPVPLDSATVTARIDNTVREVDSQNVIARIEGSDATLKNQYVVYSGHWDHLGRNPDLEGDQIFNGAVDNASGTAGLLEIAQAYKALPQAPKRSILFLAVTAEEQGLLGSKHYAQNPLYPVADTVAMLNMDAMNPFGATRDVQIIGYGQNTLEDIAEEIAASHGREIVPDTAPEKGFYYRSDQFEFAKVGIPALYADGGVDVIGKPKGYGEQKMKEYTANDYHSVSDEVKPDWDLSGMVADQQLLFEIGQRVADSEDIPTWKEGSEFKAVREGQ